MTKQANTRPAHEGHARQLGRLAATALAPLAMTAALIAATGCGEYADPFGPGQGEGGAAGGQIELGGGGVGGTEIGGAGQGAEGGGGGAVDGPTITIRFRSHTDPFDHDDGLSGQTPIDHVSGVRKLELYQNASDPNPITIFDFGNDYVEIGYNDGDDTPVHTVPIASLPMATYTIARVVHSHVRYRVAATMHAAGMGMPGEFHNVQVLSDGTSLDGQLRNHGYYEYTFVTGGQDFHSSGANAPLPSGWDTGGFSVSFENGEWAYSFPVFLPLTPEISSDIDMVLEANMFESFRWTDQDEPGYLPGVLDSTPIASEPVVHFGANDYWMTLE